MAAARRLYIYGVSAISLLALAIGLTQLLGVALDQVSEALGAGVIGGDGASSLDQLSMAIALVVVALPIWAVHWSLAERGIHGAEAEHEQQSTIRAVHFLVVGLASLSAWFLSALGIVGPFFGALLGAENDVAPSSESIAMFVVAGIGWAYHVRLRDRDLRSRRLTNDAAWLTRLYRHTGALIGLVVAGLAASEGIATLLSAAVDRPLAGPEEWWRSSLAGALSRLLVGGAVFAYHWTDARRLVRDEVGEDDRRSRTRATYFGLVIVIATTIVTFAVAGAVSSLVAWVLGVAQSSDPAILVEDVLGPILAALPWLAVGVWHRRTSLAESRAIGGTAEATTTRAALHLVSLVGLVFIAVGSARLLGLIIEAAAGQAGIGPTDDPWRHDLAQFTGLALAGIVPWAWAWRKVVDRRLEPRERGTASGRAYLYLVVGGALVAAVPSGALILYRMLNVVLGTERGAALADAAATPLGIAAVAAMVAAYHGRVLLADIRAADAATARGVEAPPGVPPIGPTFEVTVVLRGPAGSDPSRLLDELRARLPAGVTLEWSRSARDA